MIDQLDIFILHRRRRINTLAKLITLILDFGLLTALVLVCNKIAAELFKRLNQHCGYVIIMSRRIMVSNNDSNGIVILLGGQTANSCLCGLAISLALSFLNNSSAQELCAFVVIKLLALFFELLLEMCCIEHKGAVELQSCQ